MSFVHPDRNNNQLLIPMTMIRGGTNQGFIDRVEGRAAEDQQAQLAALEIAKVIEGAEGSHRAAEAGRAEFVETALQAEEKLGNRESSGLRG